MRNNVTDRYCHGALSWVSRVQVMPPGFLPCQGLDRCIEVARATVDAWFCLLSRGIFFPMLNALCSVPFLSPPQGGRNFTDVINVDSCVVSAVCANYVDCCRGPRSGQVCLQN